MNDILTLVVFLIMLGALAFVGRYKQRQCRPTPSIKFIISYSSIILKGVTSMILPDNYKVTAAFTALDSKGVPAAIDGIPVWASSNEGAITVVPSEDGLSCVCFGGLPGSAQVSVKADADLGSGITEIFGTLDFDVVAGQAVSAGIIAGTPEPQ